MEKFELEIHRQSGKSSEDSAKEAAIAAGFNCYSKPAGLEFQDMQGPNMGTYHYKWKGKLLTVTVYMKPLKPAAGQAQAAPIPVSDPPASETTPEKRPPQIALF